MIDLRLGDCREVLATIPEASIDSCVTDPPYNLASIVKRFGSPTAAPARSNGATGVYGRASAGFMGQKWDSNVGFEPETWAAVYRVLKPGAWLLAFGGTRTYHRMVCAIEDAGFEIRDQIGWAYGSGFPKSLDVSQAIDKAAGAKREVIGQGKGRTGAKAQPNGGSTFSDDSYQWPGEFSITAPATPEAAAWQGWGTALKPAWEPICVARKPLIGTVAENVLAHGTGALNIDGCRVETTEDLNGGAYAKKGGRTESQSLHGGTGMNVPGKTTGKDFVQPTGRWPANLVHDGSDEVLACFPDAPRQIARESSDSDARKDQNTYGVMKRGSGGREPRADSGSAARFFKSCPMGDEDWQAQENLDQLVRSAGSRCASCGTPIAAEAAATETSVFRSEGSPATPVYTGDCSGSIQTPSRASGADQAASIATIPTTPSPLRSSGSAPHVTASSINSDDRGRAEAANDPVTGMRFLYCPKASRAERGPGNTHPTVKPVALMRWLCRLVTPPGGLVLDPFAGSGTTGLAAQAEGFDALLIEGEPKYEAIAAIRLGLAEDVFA